MLSIEHHPVDADPVQAGGGAAAPVRSTLRRRLDAAVRPAPPAARHDPPLVGSVPPVVSRYLHFMGYDPADRGGDVRIRFRGSFRKAGLGWMPATAWQFNSASPIDRRFVMRIRFGRVLPMIATDVYRDGRGSMVGRLCGIRVADGRGPEFDAGELVTWLNDAVLFAPWLLFDGGVSFVELASSRFEVTVTDHGTTVSGIVDVDGRGAPVLFSTRDRYADLPTGRVRAEWRTPVTRWGRTRDGRAVPTAASAVWMLASGPLTYVRGSFDPSSLEIRRAL